MLISSQCFESIAITFNHIGGGVFIPRKCDYITFANAS